MVFKTEFKKIFNDYLSEFDFTYCSELNYFIKIDDESELIFFIGYYRQPAWIKTDTAFTIVAGVASVYYESFELTGLQGMEERLDSFMNSNESLFIYKKGDDESMKEAIDNSAKCVIEFVLPKWNKIVDLVSYIEYRNRRDYSSLMFCNQFYGDSLVLILANYRCDYKEVYEEKVKQNEEIIIKNGGTQEVIEESKKMIHDVLYQHLVEPRDKVFGDVDLLESALCEAQRRKRDNLMTLKKYKIT